METYNLAQRMATAPSSYYTAYSNMAQQTWTPVAHPANTYGNSLPWITAATTGNGATSANQAAGVQRTGQISGHSSLSLQGQQAIAAQGATIDLGDAVTSTSLQTIGTVRSNAPQREADIHTLETAIRILAPVIGIKRKNDTEAAKDITKQNQSVLLGFRSAWVWDISSTDGTPLPELSELVTGDVGQYSERLLAFIASQGISLEFKESIAPTLGMCYTNRIVLLPGQSPAEEFTTLVHEVGHSLLGHVARRTTTTKAVRETEAEAIAFVVGTTIGLNTGTSAATYIQLYAGNAALLTESLEVIQKTAALILSALETPVGEEPTAEPRTGGQTKHN